MSASLNNYLLELTPIGVSNNPSAPKLVGTLPPLTNKEGYPCSKDFSLATGQEWLPSVYRMEV